MKVKFDEAAGLQPTPRGKSHDKPFSRDILFEILVGDVAPLIRPTSSSKLTRGYATVVDVTLMLA